ncbi:MAG: hypothetical protein HMLKMBBP_01434 [Planctomycetes bacterium]|nr:hypothetical protein [Planctomycetota bacterium]
MSENTAAPGSATDGTIPPDPLVHKSYSVPIAVASIVLVASVALAIADEMFFRRPYKTIQRNYRVAAVAHLDRVLGVKLSAEDALRRTEEFRALDQAVRDAEDAAWPKIAKVQHDFAVTDAQTVVMADALKDPRSRISALTYLVEKESHHSGELDGGTSKSAEDLRARIAAVKQESVTYTWKKPELPADTSKPDRLAITDPVTGEDLPGWKIAPAEYETTPVTETKTVSELEALFSALQAKKGESQAALGALMTPISAARRARDEWFAQNQADVSKFLENEGGDFRGPALEEFQAAQEEVKKRLAAAGALDYMRSHRTKLDVKALTAIRDRYAAMPTDPLQFGDIRQIHVKDANNWVDRCETCHMGALEPFPMTVDSLKDALVRKWADEKGITDAKTVEERLEMRHLPLFATHPRAEEIFRHHDPEKVGCSMCHNGNGIAVNSLEQAHGLNRHWLWPLHAKEHSEAGCFQCHQDDMVLETGPRFTAARETFLEKGCWGCHEYKGFSPETALIRETENRLRDLDQSSAAKSADADQIKGLQALTDGPRKAEVAADAARRRDALAVEQAQIRLEQEQLRKRVSALYTDRQRVGPNLKDAKVKVRREAITAFIRDPQSVRPGSKMPTPQLVSDEEAKDLAAFVWQAAIDPAENPAYVLPKAGAGNAATGKTIFRERGCMSCHSVTEGGKAVGGDRAANLDHLADKGRADYVYRWIKDPRHRLAAWSPSKGRDLTPAEAAAEDPASLVWTQHTIMPDFRLSDEEARDVTAYLMSSKSGRFEQPAPWLDDAERAKRGKPLAQALGCAGCHEIRGLEEERGIGRELTYEGSQPLDRLDFGHLMLDAKAGVDPLIDWATQKDGVKVFAPEPEDLREVHGKKAGKPWHRPLPFFKHKLAQPTVYDSHRFIPDRMLRSKMPQFQWSAQELTDVTTLLTGSIVPLVPEKVRYNPGARGQAIREGWWVVKKYNCQGCHQVAPTDQPSLWNLPELAAVRAAGKDDEKLPPSLVGIGARARPDYLAAFLRDPSLGGGDARPVSTRPHLAVRMPTYELSENEIGKLVRFFQAMASQPFTYQHAEPKPLDADEKAAATEIFLSEKGGNCLSCHSVTGMKTTENTKAPNLDYAFRKLQPEWMKLWIQHPAKLVPRTAMSQQFGAAPVDGKWRVPDKTLPKANAYPGDHIDLIVRYVYWLGASKK